MKRSSLAFLSIVFACSLTLSSPASQQSRLPAAPAAPYRALLDQYCVTCHNERAKTAGLMLDTMDLEHISDSAETWEKVARKLRGGMMPPTGRPRPPNDDVYKLVSWLETSIDSAAIGKPNPGRAAIHRLNRTEYGNAIRDLLSLEIDVTDRIPILRAVEPMN